IATPGKRGLRLVFEDQGPGIADIALAMQDGYSTAGGLGMGMPGSKRLSNEFYVESVPGKGTKVTLVRWKCEEIIGVLMLVAVAERSRVAEARRLACQAAAQQGFCESDIGRIAIATTELASNLVKHAGGGEIVIGSFDDGDGTGLELLALDKGPGIGDVQT